MLELDLLLEAFLERGLDHLTPAERAAFARLIDHPDPLLHDWLLGRATPADPALRAAVAAVLAATPAPPAP